MKNYAIKVLSCNRRGHINYLSAETLQNLIETLTSDNLRPDIRAYRMVDLGYMAFDNGYLATAIGLFRDVIALILSPQDDMLRTNLKPLERYTILRAGRGLDAVWHRLGECETRHRREVAETLRELHYLRLGLDYSEILSDMGDY